MTNETSSRPAPDGRLLLDHSLPGRSRCYVDCPAEGYRREVAAIEYKDGGRLVFPHDFSSKADPKSIRDAMPLAGGEHVMPSRKAEYDASNSWVDDLPLENVQPSHEDRLEKHLAGLRQETATLTAEMKVLRATVAMGNQATLAAIKEGNAEMAEGSTELKRANSR